MTLRFAFFAALAVSIMALACDDEGEPAVTPAASQTAIAATSTPESGATSAPTSVATASPYIDFNPLDDPAIREIVTRVAALVAAKDVEGLVALRQGLDVECPQHPVFYPVCNGALDGEVRSGYSTGRFSSEGQMVDEAGLRRNLENDYFPAPQELVTIGCVDTSPPDCSHFSMVFADLDDPQLEFSYFVADRETGKIDHYASGGAIQYPQVISGGRSGFLLGRPGVGDVPARFFLVSLEAP